jgi:hypothetical protein
MPCTVHDPDGVVAMGSKIPRDASSLILLACRDLSTAHILCSVCFPWRTSLECDSTTVCTAPSRTKIIRRYHTAVVESTTGPNGN